MVRTLSRIQLPARYRVLRHIANGGMAAVYAAADEVLGREVAIKVLDPALGAGPDVRARFTREARVAARVSDHPHVVTIYDSAESEGDIPTAFIVMELVTGGTVRDRLKDGTPIPHALALTWLEQAASALDAAHAAGIVHRDVKPANLLLDGRGTLKVGDFGIATLPTETALTQTGQVVGTAAYFAPEQALGQPATAASDRYALAVVAYELLTGRRPFAELTPAAQALAHAQSDPPAPSLVAPELPAAVDGVLARGLAKDPQRRPATATALVQQLHGALGPTAATGVARPATAPTARFTREPPAADVRTPRPAPVRRPPRSSRARLLAVAAVFALLAGVAIAALAGGGNPGKRAAAVSRASTAAHRRTVATAPPATTPAAAGAPADAAAIEQRAHAALAGGDYQGAIAALGGLVQRCDVQITDPCAWAWFDLGAALRRAGNPSAAIPVLEHRLQNPDQRAAVQSELDQARAQAAGAGTQTPPAPPAKKPGHGQAHLKHGKGGD
ncbi:MAG: eukaryotic-like serine/threonine-protein kinase [Solirubrobacteraceae bacterium]|nr:eukaryotic-like serine/threonine-protein kinase [Solirubrobacteraceae bacterium]